ncbi:flagellar protein FlgN [Methylobacillus gramineus]|uniref:flagella synthesis protein FlgN n=1 Tax=Methylobacillus gramineus TaxID=755169 RepID=UPI001CFF7F88|nr:flagellar protein FlgN [Methylobacillus gramineus]MCB5183789.1 flagellar protein FlgN [Methylobacillus gramineus]
MSVQTGFDVEINLVDALLLLLKREQASLIKVDVDTMEALLNEKAQVLQDLSTATQDRYKTVSSLGFAADEHGLANWLAGQDASTQQSWARFNALVDQAKELNRLNGILINKHFNRNQNVLNTLGRSSSNQFYGPNGQSSSGSGLYNTQA